MVSLVILPVGSDGFIKHIADEVIYIVIWIKNQYVFNVSIVSIALNRLFANHQENI